MQVNGEVRCQRVSDTRCCEPCVLISDYGSRYTQQHRYCTNTTGVHLGTSMYERYIVHMFRRYGIIRYSDGIASATDEASEDLMLQGEFKSPRSASTWSALEYGVCACHCIFIEGPNLTLL